MDNPFSNRELREMFKAADDRADSFHDKLMNRMDDFEANTNTSLTRIEIQTTKTNGSVANLKMWRAYISGAVSVLMVIVVPILAWALWVLVHLPN